MNPPSKRRKVKDEDAVNDGAAVVESQFPQPPVAVATDAEKRSWQGFCEIESEPAFFNVMLKEFGVLGVKVQEVWGLDEELLAMLPQPVYGLIFLFRFKDADSLSQEAACPEHVWFANQTTDFSCATVAMLNIVNNVPALPLGEHLQQFKDFTMSFPPALRGDQIGNFEFVKQIHNTFARKMDMLNIDLGLKNGFDDRRARKSSPTKRSPASKQIQNAKSKNAKAITDEDFEEDDSAFHFIAYLPIDGEVWKLDGLDRQPAKLGPVQDGDWLSVVTPVLEMKMAEYEEGQIEFGLLSLVKDPIIHHREQLAENIRCLQIAEARLDLVKPDWRAFTENGASKMDATSNSDCLLGPSVGYGITEKMLNMAHLPDSLIQKTASEDPSRLVGLHQELRDAQGSLRAAVMTEEESNRADEERAIDRRHDYGPLIHTWLSMLAENEVVRDLVEQTA